MEYGDDVGWVGSGPRHDIAESARFQVAGGSPGWQVAGIDGISRGNRRPDD